MKQGVYIHFNLLPLFAKIMQTGAADYVVKVNMNYKIHLMQQVTFYI